MSGSGKLVEQAAAGEEVTRIIGLTPVDPQVGMPLQVPDEQESAKESLLQLLRALEQRDALGRCQQISVADAAIITLRFDGRFDVLLSPDDDFEYKLDCLLAVVDTKLEQNEKGTIDLTRKGVRFIPG